MNPSKLVVSAVVLLILMGVAAWSWVNFTQRTKHDPEVAHRYLQYFDRVCPLEFDQREICDQAIGAFHRSCFDGHIRPTPPEYLSSQGPVLYNRGLYMECMRGGVNSLLSSATQHPERPNQHHGDPK